MNKEVPTFEVVSEDVGQRRSLVFVCPKCGKKNVHGGVHGVKGGGDGHRVSHCECWPNGYFLEEI